MESAVSDQKLRRIQDLFGPVATLVAARDGDMFLAAVMAPAASRNDLFTLYAFRNEITRIPFMVSEPMIGEIRLQWWREAIEEIYSGGAVRSHEVATPLAELVRQQQLPRALFDQFIDGFSDDLLDEPAATLADLMLRVGNREEVLMQLAAEICGGTAEFKPAGTALGLSRMIVDLPRHASQGRCVIPLEIMRETEADPHVLLRGEYDARIANAYQAMCQGALEAFRSVPKMPKTARAAVLPAAIAQAALKEVSKQGFDPFRNDPKPALFKQQWACWRFLQTGRL